MPHSTLISLKSAALAARASLRGGFATGTTISTPRGPVPVQNLRRGDVIRDAEGGLHILRGVQQRSLAPQAMIEIDTRALGHDGAESDDTGETLSLAADQQVLYADWRTCILGHSAPVPIAAGRLCDGLAVRRSRKPATQVHTLSFDMSVTVLANGLPCPCPARRPPHPVAPIAPTRRSAARYTLFRDITLPRWTDRLD
ncbi:Hint domain-containing protein [Roseicitreum antarcticum]|uniref:Hint domain-containing protein n=1 Tax=Roseicitreum antarcticum TaxID=564137 RepID=A0A1H2UN45_9RHOB|nr:Hint domain-containing protein [Roseicitreum antarcticum]SDW57505.1 Hint domain-containing protein [Roseicitreum antarcticum]